MASPIRTRSHHQEYILPDDRPKQIHVSISPIAAGHITLPDSSFIAPADAEARRTVPSLAFLISHPGLPSPPPHLNLPTNTPFHFMFNLGLRKSKDRYTPAQQAHFQHREPYKLEPGVAQQLVDGGVPANIIKLVILSHVHYDHHGDPSDFPNAKYLVGRGSLEVLEHGLGGTASHQNFDAELLKNVQTAELPVEGWEVLGPFPKALDLFGDGSVYVIDAPGHLPGHVNLLCRVGRNRFAALCGDSYHDLRLLRGGKDIGFWKSEKGVDICIHVDPDAARLNIERLRQLSQIEEVELIAAHDDGWVQENAYRMFPNTL